MSSSDTDACSPPAAPARREADRDASLFAVGFAEALLAGDGARAEAIALRARDAGLSVAAVDGRVITPALYLIGHRWEIAEITIADEHLATVICHRVLARLHGTLRDVPRVKRGHVMLAAPAGQRHAIGLRMVADVLEGAGYAVTYLGADLPSEALGHAVRRHRPDVLGLSLTTPDGAPSLELAIRAALAADPQLAIVLGGQAVPERLLGPRLVRALDVESVVAVVERLLARTQRATAVPRDAPRPVIAVPAPSDACAGEQLAHAAEAIGEVAREQARQAQHFRALAFEDELCRLPNRRAFDDRFGELAATHSQPGAPPLTVMLLDVDGLKAINDELGHDAGDVALQTVAAALRSHTREHDLAARLGGDEFGALLPGLEPAAARLVAERVCMAIRSAFTGDPPTVTASCGLARFDGDRRHTLIRADQSLYEAKRAGRDRVRLATQPAA